MLSTSFSNYDLILLMKKFFFITFIAIISVISLVFIGFNIYKGVTILNYNDLLNFAIQYSTPLTDNKAIAFQLEFNPVTILDQVNSVNHKSEIVKSEISAQYVGFVTQISSTTMEISELSNQAKALSLNITDNFESTSSIFSIPVNFDEISYQSAKVRFDYLTGYKTYLKSLFAEFKTNKLKQGKFSNPLWGYSDLDLSNLINSMSDEDKAGQLLFFSFDGISLTNDQITRYKALNPGGMIIMGNNVSYPKQVQALTSQIQKINPNIPMFITTDEEGGVVKRIDWDTTAGEKSWATMSDTDLCNLGKERSDLLLGLGINMNFSPVVDLTNPRNAFINNRTISGDPLVVASKAQAYITCGQNEGIVDTLKHFPGHGSTTLDSHYQLPYVTKSSTAWLASDAIPFKNNLDSKQIMVGHLVYTQIDKDNPASLSHIFLTDILRTQWGYKGLIITDDMNMLHTSTGISVHDALLRTFNAGTDIATYVGAPTSFEDVKSQLVNLIKTGAITKERVDDALMRILSAKRDLNY